MSHELHELFETLKSFEEQGYPQKWPSSEALATAIGMGCDSEDFLELLDWLELEINLHLSEIEAENALKKLAFLRNYGIRTVIIGLPVTPTDYRCLILLRILEAILMERLSCHLTGSDVTLKAEGNPSSSTLTNNDTAKPSGNQIKPQKYCKFPSFKANRKLEPLKFIRFPYHSLEEAISLDCASLEEASGLDWYQTNLNMLRARCFAMAADVLSAHQCRFDAENPLSFYSLPGIDKAMNLIRKFTVDVFKGRFCLDLNGTLDKDKRAEEIDKIFQEAKDFYEKVVAKLQACQMEDEAPMPWELLK